MGVFLGGAFKIPLYDKSYEPQILNKIGLPYLTNGFLYFKMFLPEHFPPYYCIDPYAEHYIVPQLHLKEQQKLQELVNMRKIQKEQHSKHEGNTDNDQKKAEEGILGYNYDYNKVDIDTMIQRVTKELNKFYVDQLLDNNNAVLDKNNQKKSIYKGTGKNFWDMTIDEKIRDLKRQDRITKQYKKIKQKIIKKQDNIKNL
ncbi:hypothetical protein IMG5_069890 [Ichthyophthirius multifiliis]|uniref:Uncharacterized protein n=1 Tax=Ichthyophthirius multifiliis TaxID=5932 RepID=G0QPN8_ICHMU|nr:hypothetical protein IMG5_069890 [Ichthyophthirius multifiliis]EGR32816.1 hypothetical protein IMG5_069890 [Ichthyophthirius multifiliis]|eukprot:XP_004036802.1 hypothetical protein IMG5_069890 [Ichthyophthirius multifiliis]